MILTTSAGSLFSAITFIGVVIEIPSVKINSNIIFFIPSIKLNIDTGNMNFDT